MIIDLDGKSLQFTKRSMLKILKNVADKIQFQVVDSRERFKMIT